MIDEISYMMGVYNYKALEIALHNFGLLFDPKHTPKPEKYLESPFLLKETEKDIENMTEEELNKAIQREIEKEELWIKNSRIKGLPETKIRR